MPQIFFGSDVTATKARIEKLFEEREIPPMEFARVLLNVAEENVRKVAQEHLDAGRTLHEPDFIDMADKIAGVVANTEPRAQHR